MQICSQGKWGCYAACSVPGAVDPLKCVILTAHGGDMLLVLFLLSFLLPPYL